MSVAPYAPQDSLMDIIWLSSQSGLVVASAPTRHAMRAAALCSSPTLRRLFPPAPPVTLCEKKARASQGGFAAPCFFSCSCGAGGSPPSPPLRSPRSQCSRGDLAVPLLRCSAGGLKRSPTKVGDLFNNSALSPPNYCLTSNCGSL